VRNNREAPKDYMLLHVWAWLIIPDGNECEKGAGEAGSE
jgi:hypothetical protein